MTEPTIQNQRPIEVLISRMSNSMNAYPPAFQGDTLNLLFLNDTQPIRDAPGYLRNLDSPNLCDDCREYLISDESSFWPFPRHCINERPDPQLLSEILYNKFDIAHEILPTQRDIGPILCEKAKRLQPDVIALMIVDGLSYYDLPQNTDAQPCLVNGVTLTEFGYREVIGKPSISERLFNIGYSQQIGFTYFDVESNPLANELYSVFGDSQIKRIIKFKDCIDYINTTRISYGFIQITVSGLDVICHHHQDEPPVKYYTDEILKRFEQLIRCLQSGHQRVLACLTADHGILWRKNLDGQWEVVRDLHPDDTRAPRYIRGSRIKDYLLVRSCLRNTYSMLRTPYITRAFRNNEWGVHGGISAWESIVPLIIRAT